MKKIIVIMGPTGVGKTKLSVELAKKINAVIINADSISMYKYLNIGSAKPTRDEMQGIKHYFIDKLELNEDYTIYDYQKDARCLIDKIDSNIIIVGGSGLYIKALLYDYKFEKEDTKFDYSNYSNQELLNEIKKINNNVEIHINNRNRLERVLTKLKLNQDINKKSDLLYDATFFSLTCNRNTLYERINNRVDKMIENGLIKEISNLKGYYKTSKVLSAAIGYKEFYDYFYNNKSLDLVIDEIKKNSRHYAKRQLTFFKHQFNSYWINVNFNDFNKTIEEVYSIIEKD